MSELKLYGSNVIDGIKQDTKESMKEFVEVTKKDAPKSKKKRSGTFSRNIISKKTLETENRITYTWYVKDPEYRLTHLIKNGHQTRKGDRKTKANDFLTENYNKVEKKYLDKIERRIGNV